MVFLNHVAANKRPAIQIKSSQAQQVQPSPRAVSVEEAEDKPKKGRKAKAE